MRRDGRNPFGVDVSPRSNPGLRQPWALGHNRFAVSDNFANRVVTHFANRIVTHFANRIVTHFANCIVTPFR
jgi:hypothetical protein